MWRHTRWALAAATVAYSVAVFGSGMDRLSSLNPAFERIVPGPFRSNAEVADAAAHGDRKELSAANIHAQRAVMHSPLERKAVGTLALVNYMRGQDAAADAAFRVSAKLGWRDVPTQLYWYQVGIDSGDFTLAAQRADAVLRANPTYPGIQQLLQPFESDPAGQSALLERIVERPVWLDRYAMTLPTDNPPALQRRAAMLEKAAGKGITLGCPAVKSLTFQLFDNGLRDDALRLWSQQCSYAPVTTRIFDPKFQALGAERTSPFDWKTARAGDVEVQTAKQRDGQLAAEVANGSAFPVAVLSQLVTLPKGQYRARMEVDDLAIAKGRLFATLTCGTVPRRQAGEAGDMTGNGQVLEVPDCKTQNFAIWLRPGGKLVLRQVSIDPQAKAPE